MCKNATVVIFTGLPNFDVCGPPSEKELRRRDFYQAPDGSIVEVNHHFWEKNGRKHLDFAITQTWADGEDYHGACCVMSLDEARCLPRAPADAGERIYAWMKRDREKQRTARSLTQPKP